MTGRSCSSARSSSKPGGTRGRIGKEISGARAEDWMPVTQSADLPVGPFGAEPAAPALAGKAPPDALAAAPVIARAALSSVLLLWVAGPAAAIAPVPAHHHSCPAKHAQQQS